MRRKREAGGGGGGRHCLPGLPPIQRERERERERREGKGKGGVTSLLPPHSSLTLYSLHSLHPLAGEETVGLLFLTLSTTTTTTTSVRTQPQCCSLRHKLTAAKQSKAKRSKQLAIDEGEEAEEEEETIYIVVSLSLYHHLACFIYINACVFVQLLRSDSYPSLS